MNTWFWYHEIIQIGGLLYMSYCNLAYDEYMILKFHHMLCYNVTYIINHQFVSIPDLIIMYSSYAKLQHCIYNKPPICIICRFENHVLIIC